MSRIPWVQIPPGPLRFFSEKKCLEDEEEAEEELTLETLKHEFIDYAISKVIESYREATNRLIATINEDAYRKRKS